MSLYEEPDFEIETQLKVWLNSTQNSPINRSVEGFIRQSGRALDLLSETGVSAFIYDFQNANYSYFNDYFAKFMGVDRAYIEQVGIRIMQERVHPEDFLKCLDITQQALREFSLMKEVEQDSTHFRFFFRVRKPSGEYCWAMQSNRHIRWSPDFPSLDLAYIIELFDQSHPMKVMGVIKTANRNLEIYPNTTTELLGSLTQREMEILKLISFGLSTKDISEKLVIASNTVKTHRRNIIGKLGVKNMMQAATMLDQFK
jgi:DNA-binding CsgD family transcriptional regulator/PAS domain-containing protein